MSDISSRVETLSNRHPEAEQVGPHLVTDKTEWVPGKHPDPHRRHEGQTECCESYVKCLRCGVSVLNKRDLPEECDA